MKFMQSSRKDYISVEECKSLKELFFTNLKLYKEKGPNISDQEWLTQLMKFHFTDMEVEETKRVAKEIVDSIDEFNGNLKEINEGIEQGISKETWLEKKIQQASVGMSVQECGKQLQLLDDVLAHKNLELADALTKMSDGQIKMSPNLDGNIAENMLANSTELSAFLQGQNIKVEVRDVFTPNSVDVRALNLDTGKYQNYQMKFGKDAKATIDLIERGNYNNQQIVVPTEQLEEVQAYFKQKGSKKTVTDHIDAWGAKGKKFTKQEMKDLQRMAQEDGLMPTMDYSHYQMKDLFKSIGRNTGLLSLQSMALTTGFNVVHKALQGEEIEADELVEVAIKTGADTSLKVVTAGTLQVAVRKGIIKLIPRATPAGIIANIACVGIENVKVLSKIMKGEISLPKGIDQMGRVTTSMIGGLYGCGKGFVIGALSTAWIPVIGPATAVVTGVIGGMVGYACGSKIGEKIYETAKKVENTVKTYAKAAWDGIKSVGRKAVNGVKSFCKLFS